MNTTLSTSKTKLGLWLDDLRLELRKAIKLTGQWQLETVGLDSFGSEVSPKNLSQTGRRDLAHLLRSHNLRISAIRADVGGRRLTDPETLDAALHRIRASFELARDLQSPRVLIPLGFIPEEDSQSGKERQCLRESLKALQAFAASFGALPVVPPGSEKPETLRAFLEAEDRSGLLQLDWSPGISTSRGIEPLELMRIFGNRITMATAKDHYRGGGEAPMGEGDVPWGEIIVGLSTLTGHEPPVLLAGCTLECNRPQALQTSIYKLKMLRQNPLKFSR